MSFFVELPPDAELDEVQRADPHRKNGANGRARRPRATPSNDHAAVPDFAVEASPLAPGDPLPEGIERFGGLANAYRLAREHGADLRHDPAHEWMVWDGSVWRQDETEAYRRALDICQRLLRHGMLLDAYARRLARIASENKRDEAAKEAAKEARGEADRFLDFARRSQSEPEVRRMLEVARHLSPIATTPDIWDPDEWLVGVANGTLDLRTGALRPPERAEYMTRTSPVAFDPTADAPTWRAMLDRVLPDPEVRTFVQKFAGYSLSGSTREQCFAVLWGGGGNGKSTLLEVLRHVVGTYAMATSTDTLMSARGQRRGPENEIARLRGARLVTAVESNEGRKLDEERIKQLTGGDVVSARYLFREFFDFRPAFKLWLAVNHRPEIRGTDLGIWRRVRLIPFDVTIEPHEKDLDLKIKLIAEAPGILRWAVDGCLAWQREGLTPPPAVMAATSEWRADSNVVAQFLEQQCTRAQFASCRAGALYQAFVGWARAEGVEPVTQTAFGRRLGALGLESDRGAHGTRIWRGVGLVTEDEVTGVGS